jgi:hypothetical protein
VRPRELHDEIAARFGPVRFDDVDEFDADDRLATASTRWSRHRPQDRLDGCSIGA